MSHSILDLQLDRIEDWIRHDVPKLTDFWNHGAGYAPNETARRNMLRVVSAIRWSRFRKLEFSTSFKPYIIACASYPNPGLHIELFATIDGVPLTKLYVDAYNDGRVETTKGDVDEDSD